MALSRLTRGASRALRSSCFRGFAGSSDLHHSENVDWNVAYFARKQQLEFPKPERKEWVGRDWMWIKESGPVKSNTVLIFAHRFLLDHTQWDPVVERLNKKYRCLQYDLPCHGKNADLDGGYDASEFCGDILHMLRQPTMGNPQYFVLIGDEFGARLAYELAHHQTEGQGRAMDFYVDGVVMVNSGFDNWTDSQTRQLETIIGQWRSFGLTKEVQGMIAAYVLNKKVDDPAVSTWIEKWKKIDPDSLYAMFRYLTIFDGFRDITSDYALRNIPFPTLLIRGTKDGSLTDDHIREWVAHQPIYPRKVSEIVGGSLITMEEPRLVAGAIEDFLQTLELDLTEKETDRRIYL